MRKSSLGVIVVIIIILGIIIIPKLSKQTMNGDIREKKEGKISEKKRGKKKRKKVAEATYWFKAYGIYLGQGGSGTLSTAWEVKTQ